MAKKKLKTKSEQPEDKKSGAKPAAQSIKGDLDSMFKNKKSKAIKKPEKAAAKPAKTTEKPEKAEKKD